MSYGSNNYLFRDGDLREFLRQRKIDMKTEIDGISESDLLALEEGSWSTKLAEKYALELPTLLRDDEYIGESKEIQVDVSADPERSFIDRLEPYYVPGRSVTYHLPYSGDQVLLRLGASTYTFNPPRADLVGNEIRLDFTYPSGKKPNIKSEIEDVVGSIAQHLGWQQADVKEFNDALLGEALALIRARKNRVLEDREFLGDLGIPVKAREDAPTTYSAPGIARKATPASKTATKASVRVEPTLIDDLYEHICDVVRSAGRAMERTPGAYADRDEETLRDFILTMLNTHYEGQATGETFQVAGKTDILVRVENQNVFVGECKWWSGPAAFGDAIGQLYSYTTLRDTKLALVVFVGAKGFGEIVSKARATIEAHDSFVSWLPASEKGELRASVVSPDDPSRQATLHVFLFHIPGTAKD